MTYHGQCHCGAIRFQFTSEPITSACKCNCSFCIRKGAIMSERYYSPDEFELASGDSLVNYLWGDKMVNHWFCRVCGIHPLHDTTEKPGHYRVNLGCVDELDALALPVRLIDGRSL